MSENIELPKLIEYCPEDMVEDIREDEPNVDARGYGELVNTAHLIWQYIASHYKLKCTFLDYDCDIIELEGQTNITPGGFIGTTKGVQKYFSIHEVVKLRTNEDRSWITLAFLRAADLELCWATFEVGHALGTDYEPFGKSITNSRLPL